MDGHEDGNYLRKVLENGMHNCNHAAEIVAPADRVEVVGQGLEVLTLLVAGGFASTDRCSCAALASHNVGGLSIDCGCPRFLFHKGQQHSPEVRMVDERLRPGTVPS
jgi:hypothetical protein